MAHLTVCCSGCKAVGGLLPLSTGEAAHPAISMSTWCLLVKQKSQVSFSGVGFVMDIIAFYYMISTQI